MNPLPADHALLAAWIASADETALATLAQRYRPMLALLGRRILRDPAGAEDVAQEALTRLAEDAAGITGSIEAWLRTVATNLAISHLRARVRRHRREAEAAKPAPSPPLLDEADEHALVAECVAALNAQERDLVVRVFWLGHTQETIARDHQVSRVAISKRMRGILERLRRQLGRRGLRLGLPTLATLLLGSRDLPAEIVPLTQTRSAGATATAVALAVTLPLAIVLLAPSDPWTGDPSAPAPPPAANLSPSAEPAPARNADQEWHDLAFSRWRFIGVDMTRPKGDTERNPTPAFPLPLDQCPQVRMLADVEGPRLRLQAGANLTIFSLAPDWTRLEDGAELRFEQRPLTAPAGTAWTPIRIIHLVSRQPRGLVHRRIRLTEDSSHGRELSQWTIEPPGGGPPTLERPAPTAGLGLLHPAHSWLSALEQQVALPVFSGIEMRNPQGKHLTAAERNEVERLFASQGEFPPSPSTAPAAF